MARKKQIEIQKGFEQKKIMESIIGLMETGEALGNELITLLSEYGSSHEGLLIEVYAISKAYGALMAVAEEKGYDALQLFEGLWPTFFEEMKDVL